MGCWIRPETEELHAMRKRDLKYSHGTEKLVCKKAFMFVGTSETNRLEHTQNLKP
jgi:hypothetical protein